MFIGPPRAFTIVLVITLLFLGVHCWGQGDSPEMEKLRAKIENNEEDFLSCYNLATLYANQNRMNEAIEFFTRATERNPEMTQAYYNLGVARQSLKQFSEASVALNRAVELDPDMALWFKIRSATSSLPFLADKPAVISFRSASEYVSVGRVGWAGEGFSFPSSPMKRVLRRT